MLNTNRNRRPQAASEISDSLAEGAKKEDSAKSQQKDASTSGQTSETDSEETVYTGKVGFTSSNTGNGTGNEKPKQSPQVTYKGEEKSGNGKTVLVAVLTILILVVIAFFAANSRQGSYTSAAPATDSDSVVVDTTYTRDLHYRNSKGIAFSYTGQIVDGQPNGQGTGYYGNGTYTGKYVNGLRQGEGTFETSDGKNYYKGTFNDDEYYQGTLKLNTGVYFTGYFSGGQPYNGAWYNADGSYNSDVTEGK